MNATDVKIRPEQADELIALYCDWREECVVVEAAYERLKQGQMLMHRAALLCSSALA